MIRFYRCGGGEGEFEAFLQRACDTGCWRPDLADATIKAMRAHLTICLSSSRPTPKAAIFETPSSSMPKTSCSSS
jgi:hypothetical protein